jgi:signal transduction histidine kinase
MGLQYLEAHLSIKNSPVDEECVDVLKDVKRSCDEAVEILNQLLLYDKIESGLIQLEKTSISPYDFLEDVINPFRNMVMQYLI